MEKTLIILKPDAVQRRLLGKIITRFEEKGFQIIGLKMIRISEALARKHYGVHEGKDFFEPLVRYTTSAPVIVMVLKSKNTTNISIRNYRIYSARRKNRKCVASHSPGYNALWCY